MKKLKSIDFKALFMNHGEKFGLVMIVLFVLLALSRTSWSRYGTSRDNKSPENLKTLITDAKNRITSPDNKWPDSKSAQFAVIDFNGKARDVFTGLNTAKYEFTTPLFWPLYRKKEKAREPELSAPQLLFADSGVAVLMMRPQQAATLSTPDGTSGDPARPGETPTNSTIRPVEGSLVRPGPGAPGTGGAGPTAPFGIAPAAPGRPTPGGRGAGPGAGHGTGPSAGPGMVPGMEMNGGGSFGGGGGTARGERFITVRAIVPIKEQIERAMKALNMSYADASAAIEYTDFILQRQVAVAGPEPWSGPWEVVDPKRSLEVLRDCDSDDADPVPSDLQDVAITSPLPKRLLRYWGDVATHPSIKHFQPTEAERLREEKLVDQFLETAKKLNLETQSTKKGGFADLSYDVRALSKNMMMNPMGNDAMQNMAKQMNEGGTGPRMAAPDIQNRLTASGRLYLFRYIDFDVQPGMAYRYQVRLKLRNPLYKRPYEEVENPEFTKEEFSLTAWSNISNPAVVPKTIHYFLKDVDRDPVREDKHNSKRPVANIAMFEWDAKLGTMLYDSLKILSVGQFISEKKKTMVLDPATPTFEEKEIPFVTEDMLVDASGDLDLSLAQHPDLLLKADRGRKDTAKAGILQEALVVTAQGQLKDLDPVSEFPEEQSLKQTVDEERKPYEYLRDAPRASTSSLDGGAYPGMPPGMGISGNGGMPGMTPPGGGRGGNPRRKPGGGNPMGGAPGATGEGAPGGGEAKGPGGATGGGKPRPR